MLYLGPEILDDNVGVFGQGHEDFQPLGSFQIQAQSPFVTMQIEKIRAVAGPAQAFFLVRRHLDLDRIGAPIRQLAHGGGPGAGVGQIKYADALKGQFAFAHGGFLTF